MDRKKIIIITGPTASGKTALSIEFARAKNLEIISADSRQVYRGMDIGTGKVQEDEAKGVKHYLIDIVNPDEDYNAHNFYQDAAKLLMEGKEKLVVGGTIFYIKSLISSTLKAPSVDKVICESLEQEYDLDSNRLYEKLQTLDPEASKKIHKNDRYRVVRALSVIEETGKPYSFFKKQKMESQLFENVDTDIYAIEVNRDKLYRDINNRVDIMVEKGLFSEVEGLLAKGYKPDLKAFRAPGYRELIEYIEGHITKDVCIEEVKQATRNFAKRQISMLKTLPVTMLPKEQLLDKLLKDL